MQGIGSVEDTNKAWFFSIGSLESSEVTDQCTYCNQLSCNRHCDNCCEKVYSVIQ